MKKTTWFFIALLLLQTGVTAQSKIFKEIGEEISSRVTTIRQDNELVGYLVFTQLEKISEDSFNYRITIVDENLNDISTYDFKDQSLYLQHVALEQDVLCIAYLKSNVVGRVFKNNKEYKSFRKDHATNSDLLLQFLQINGQLVKRTSIPLELDFWDVPTEDKQVQVTSSLKEEIQLRNIPQQGFAVFYGDDFNNVLVVLKPDGSISWKKMIKESNALDYVLLTSKEAVYMLMRKTGTMALGDYDLDCYDIQNKATFPRYKIKGKEGNRLHAIAFNNDPVTGLPFLTGFIYTPNLHEGTSTNAGWFTLNFAGTTNTDPQAVYTFWKESNQSTLPYDYKKNVSEATFAFKDFGGNVYFTGISKSDDARRAREEPTVLLKQDARGVVSMETSIPNGKKGAEMAPAVRSYSMVVNRQAKACYFIRGDAKEVSVYDIAQKKVTRTISRQDGQARIHIFPAKEGHIMVSEYNKKEKYTRVSIEPI